ncbi:MAG: alpha-ketoglutarate-dependent dioxygenase AlkB [Bacteroidetes bacterium]|nr:alpha-ketoglutarate-dependent dioxygenase AlkB [Bacteroidota bacterium]
MEEDLIFLNPSRDSDLKKIYLTKSKSVWIEIDWLSEELINYAEENYQDLFQLHPTERGRVVMYGKDNASFRWHRSYLNTPVFDLDLHGKKSYMYSGKEGYSDLSLPTSFQFFLDYINSKEEDKYNQVIVNWYASGKDYIAAHSDCEIGIKPHTGIALLSLYRDENTTRDILFTSKRLKNEENDAVYNKLKIKMNQGCIITMGGDMQKLFRHRIPQDVSITAPRISLTFRKFLTHN